MPYGRRRRRRDSGQVAIEYLGFLPVLLIVGLAGIQIGAVAYAAEQAGTAARAGARAASLGKGAQEACDQAASLKVNCFAERGGDSVTVTASVTIPKILWGFGDARKTATMPMSRDD
ncbi:TadE/TadG family type IV pilus assembly protein [Streptomyces sp. NK08204]|uniref:TadE/TadG family type IV pilus assembly protein n=1 Tax=Streptomyces sp. NK08204 TaxID=2873260 RepID=UPI001CEDD5C0|nr:TadE/TadG family type IV pilus assembly protein [Streptomyces sp. NK08204]